MNSMIIRNQNDLEVHKTSRVGIFAGSFNPCHIGHLSIAEQALQAGLENILFIPLKTHPHKQNCLVESALRIQMLENLLFTSQYSEQFCIVDPNYINGWFDESTFKKITDVLNPIIICGNDIYFEVYPEFLKSFDHFIFMRPGSDKVIHRSVLKGSFIECLSLHNISSTQIRSGYESGNGSHISRKIHDLIVVNNLYVNERAV